MPDSSRRTNAAALRRDPFDALGDANRRAIVTLLGTRPRSVQDLADELPISRPAVSRHLRLLREAGLVVEAPQGTRRIYRLHDAGIDAVRAYLEEVWGAAATRFRLFADNAGAAADATSDARAGAPSGEPRTPDAGGGAP